MPRKPVETPASRLSAVGAASAVQGELTTAIAVPESAAATESGTIKANPAIVVIVKR